MKTIRLFNNEGHSPWVHRTIGSNLLEFLLNDPDFIQIITIGRNNPDIDHAKLIKIQKNYDDWIQTDFEGDVLFCCLGTTIKKAQSRQDFRHVDYEMPLKASILFQGHFILVSALGADQKSKVFYNRVKGEVERDIKRVGRKLSIVRPSLILGRRPESRPLESIAQKIMPIFNFLMVPKMKAIKASEVAKTMVEIAKGKKVSNPNIEYLLGQ